MHRSLEDLRADRLQLNSQLKDTKKQIKQEQQQNTGEARSTARMWQMTPRLTKVALTIYMIAQYRADPAIKFLHIASQKRRWPSKTDEELQRMVEDLFLQADVDEVSRMCDLEEPDDLSATAEALKYVEEWRAIEYVKDLNSRLGVAPSTEDILLKVEENRLQIPGRCRPGSKGTAAEVKARIWAKRFRARWGGRYGKLRIADDMGLAEMQQKVPFSTPFVVGFGQGRL